MSKKREGSRVAIFKRNGYWHVASVRWEDGEKVASMQYGRCKKGLLTYEDALLLAYYLAYALKRATLGGALMDAEDRANDHHDQIEREALHRERGRLLEKGLIPG